MAGRKGGGFTAGVQDIGIKELGELTGSNWQVVGWVDGLWRGKGVRWVAGGGRLHGGRGRW